MVKHVYAKFQLSSFNTDGLNFFFDIFSRKFQNFSEELKRILKNIKSEYVI
jgi:hypothetical protein